MQAPPQSVYANILNQAEALDQAYQYQIGPGRSNIGMAAEKIRLTREIVLIAVGASYSACIPFVYRLNAAGWQARLEDVSEFAYYSHKSTDSQAVYLLVSRSGETIEVVKALQILKILGRQVIGLTNEGSSTLARLSDIPLIIGGPSDYLISIQTYLTTLFTLHHLATLVIADPQDSDYQIEMQKLISLVQATLQCSQEACQEWRDRFIPYQAIYLLGRGQSLASAYQGSLLFHEMARTPGLAFSGGALRHGPWEALDERMLAFVFAPPDETYELNISLAMDLCALGSRVVLVTAQPAPVVVTELKKFERLELWEIPACPVEFATFLEILPVELFIFEYACWLGLAPGIFRACTPITLAETGSLANRQ